MADLHSAAQEVNAALDKITQAGTDQQKIHQAVAEAKQKVQALVQQAGQHSGSEQQHSSSEQQRDKPAGQR